MLFNICYAKQQVIENNKIKCQGSCAFISSSDLSFLAPLSQIMFSIQTLSLRALEGSCLTCSCWVQQLLLTTHTGSLLSCIIVWQQRKWNSPTWKVKDCKVWSCVKTCNNANTNSLPSKLAPARDWSGEQPPVLLLKEVKRCWHSSSGMSFSR